MRNAYYYFETSNRCFVYSRYQLLPLNSEREQCGTFLQTSNSLILIPFIDEWIGKGPKENRLPSEIWWYEVEFDTFHSFSPFLIHFQRYQNFLEHLLIGGHPSCYMKNLKEPQRDKNTKAACDHEFNMRIAQSSEPVSDRSDLTRLLVGCIQSVCSVEASRCSLARKSRSVSPQMDPASYTGLPVINFTYIAYIFITHSRFIHLYLIHSQLIQSLLIHS